MLFRATFPDNTCLSAACGSDGGMIAFEPRRPTSDPIPTFASFAAHSWANVGIKKTTRNFMISGGAFEFDI
jgi:hypothetical protein